jgi:glycosyltransferase involved in cell wall biosynthesis
MDILLEAAAILSNEGFDFKLVVAGEGPQLEPLRNLSLTLGLQSRVAFVGRVAEEDLVEMFRAGDCFVLPTRSLEGFGLIILEAYACGTPVIAVPVGAIADVMGASRQDWIALDNSAIALAQRMRDFLLRRLVADRGQLRRRALEFDFCYMAAQHQRVLFQVETDPIASLQ